MSWRRLRVLVQHLPASSATARAVGGEQFEWTVDTHLLANVTDLLSAISWQLGGDKRAKKPPPLHRPGMTPDGDQVGKSLSISEWQRRRAARLERGRAEP